MIIELPGYRRDRNKHYVNLNRLNDDSIIVDVGACQGNVIKELREHKETSKCKIFAIECNKKLARGLKEENFFNVEICEKALVGENIEGDVTFFEGKRGPNWGTIKPANISDRWGSATDSYDVKTLKINDIFNEFGIDKIDFMKMDTEGSEKMIFETMSLEIAKKIKQISVEVHWPNRGVAITMVWAEKKLEQFGFEVKRRDHAEIFCERE